MPQNFTTTSYGFFGWLGSATNYITNIFTNDITVNGTVTAEDLMVTNYVNFTGGGYMYDNGTATIIGHS